MGIYAKKTLAGYKAVEDGSNDSGADFYLMTRKEYEELQEQQCRDRSKAIEAENNAEIHKESFHEQVNCQLGKNRYMLMEDQEKRLKEAEDRISALREKIRRLQTELSHAINATEAEQGLNQNLLRIMRERANAKRNVIPKKKHDGFLVIESRQWSEHYRVDVWADGIDPEEYAEPESRTLAYNRGLLRTEARTDTVWRSVLQTPYDASLHFDQLNYLLNRDFDTVLPDLGCGYRLVADSMGSYVTAKSEQDSAEAKCILYRWQGRANFRSGLWELEIWTTEPLVVPEERRPDYVFKETSNSRKALRSKKDVVGSDG